MRSLFSPVEKRRINFQLPLLFDDKKNCDCWFSVELACAHFVFKDIFKRGDNLLIHAVQVYRFYDVKNGQM